MSAISTIFNRVYWIKQRATLAFSSASTIQQLATITVSNKEPSGMLIGHVAMYTDGNAGDTLLPRTVRDAVDGNVPHEWRGIHAHRVVTGKLLREINGLDGLLIGGGGLFLRDTNPNNLSGWQWSCSIKALEQIDVPIALFAVGYNRFRGQKDFKPIFKRHLEILAEKSVYLGLRNSGSIRAVRSYLPSTLHQKVRFQPCPTTLCKQLYPSICSAEHEQPTIALNCAFDRIDLRLGDKKDAILSELAESAKALSERATIIYYSHARSDERMLPYLEKAGVPYQLKRLYFVPPRDVVKAYSEVSLAIGMRGHAQMVPFGCGTPIISLISHDKVRWFLEDIGQPDWGVEISRPDFKSSLVEAARHALEHQATLRNRIDEIQVSLLKTTRTNAADFIKAIT